MHESAPEVGKVVLSSRSSSNVHEGAIGEFKPNISLLPSCQLFDSVFAFAFSRTMRMLIAHSREL